MLVTRKYRFYNITFLCPTTRPQGIPFNQLIVGRVIIIGVINIVYFRPHDNVSNCIIKCIFKQHFSAVKEFWTCCNTKSEVSDPFQDHSSTG